MPPSLPARGQRLRRLRFFEGPRRLLEAAAVRDGPVELGPELAQDRVDGRDGSIPEGADRLARDGLRDLLQGLDVLRYRSAVPHAGQEAKDPAGALAAGRALAAGLVLGEGGG